MSSFGTTEVFANANANVAFQLDTANFIAVARIPAKADPAADLVRKLAPRMGYMHLKTSTKDLKQSPVLDENILIFEIVFWEAVKNKKSYVAIELFPPDTMDQVLANHKKSIEYLRQNF